MLIQFLLFPSLFSSSSRPFFHAPSASSRHRLNSHQNRLRLRPRFSSQCQPDLLPPFPTDLDLNPATTTLPFRIRPDGFESDPTTGLHLEIDPNSTSSLESDSNPTSPPESDSTATFDIESLIFRVSSSTPLLSTGPALSPFASTRNRI